MEMCKFQDIYVLGICLALSKFAIELRSNFPAHIPAHDNPWSMEVLRLGQLSPALWASVRVKLIRAKGGKRTQTVMGRSIEAHTATKITGNSPKGRAANPSPTHIGNSPIRASASGKYQDLTQR
jgi:hypothetical protein